MKKLLIALSVVIVSASAFAQGTVTFANNSGTLVSTNAGVGAIGTTATTSQGFYYALFIQSYSGTLTSNSNLLAGGWTFTGNYATNTAAVTGGRFSGGSGVAVSGWGAGVTNEFMVAGWSANLGTTWSQIQSQLQTAAWSSTGFFGVSSISFGAAGGGAQSLPSFALFTTTGPNGQGDPIQTGFNLNLNIVPEPGTMALMALGSASLLLFRRKK